MTRKAIIVLLTLGAVGTVVIAVVTRPADPDGWPHDPWELILCQSEHLWVDLSVGIGHVKVVFFLPRDEFSFDSEVSNLHPMSVYWARDYMSHKGLYVRRLGYGETRGVVTVFPIWNPFVLLAAYPTIAFVRGPMRRWRRRRKGLCIKCGYNLTGNVSGVCPECGEVL